MGIKVNEINGVSSVFPTTICKTICALYNPVADFLPQFFQRILRTYSSGATNEFWYLYGCFSYMCAVRNACYSDVIWTSWHLMSRTTRLFIQQFIQRTALPVLCGGIHMWPGNFPPNGPVPQKEFPCHDVLRGHYCDVIMGTNASQIASLPIVYSTVYSGAGQRKHQSSASLAFVWGIHRRPVNSPHKWPVTRKMFPFDDVIGSSAGRCSHRLFLHFPPINIPLYLTIRWDSAMLILGYHRSANCIWNRRTCVRWMCIILINRHQGLTTNTSLTRTSLLSIICWAGRLKIMGSSLGSCRWLSSRLQYLHC